MEQQLRVNVGRASTCRSPWPRTLRSPAPLFKHFGRRSTVRTHCSIYETTVHRTGQAQLRQQQLRQSGEVSVTSKVDVSFVINYCAEYGQQVVLLGSCQELGSWDTAAAVRLTWQQGDNWKAAVQLPAPIDSNVELEYKYAVIGEDGSTQLWQEGPNISLVLSPKPAETLKPQQLNLKEAGDPCDPGLLAADRRLAAATDVFRSLASSPEPDSLQEEQQQEQQLQEVNA
ncbi:hypothetical protein OEZ86_000452 [Tetradesmus obliquus]|nr:hypothetical protein OEZ86_000452 [Tetradesmus obliquus]